MKKKEFCYILIVAVMGVSLLLGFAVEVFGVDLGPAAWVAGWVSSPVALAIGFVFAMLFGKAFPDFNKTLSKKLLQFSVIGHGAGFGQRRNAVHHRQCVRHSCLGMVVRS